MLKRIPKSDITIRPFKAHKTWNFSSGSNEIGIFQAVEGNYNSTDTTTSNGKTFYKNSLYGQLKAQFYTDTYNPFKRSGNRTNIYYPNTTLDERYLSGSAIVISIPEKCVGEGIKRGSVRLVDNTNIYLDDGFGNLSGNNIAIELDVVNFDNEEITLQDLTNVLISFNACSYVLSYPLKPDHGINGDTT
jgi:hypothetical protein